MAAAKPTLTEHPLVAEIYDLDARIDALLAEKAEKSAELIAQGDGHYVELVEREAGAGKRVAIVVTPSAPKPTYTLYPDGAKKVFLAGKGVKNATPELSQEFVDGQEGMARKLAGIRFSALFDRKVIFVPAKGFADMVPRLFPTATATAAKLLLLCQVVKAAGKAHVKLRDKPKKTAEAGGDEEE